MEGQVFLLVGVGLLVLGMICLGACLHFYGKANHFVALSVKTTGEVVEVTSKIVERREVGSDTVTRRREYTPKVKFVTRAGKTILFTPSISSNRANTIGDKIDLYYAPDNPKDARLKENIYFWPTFFGIFAGVLLFIGISFVFV